MDKLVIVTYFPKVLAASHEVSSISVVFLSLRTRWTRIGVSSPSKARNPWDGIQQLKAIRIWSSPFLKIFETPWYDVRNVLIRVLAWDVPMGIHETFSTFSRYSWNSTWINSVNKFPLPNPLRRHWHRVGYYANEKWRPVTPTKCAWNLHFIFTKTFSKDKKTFSRFRY